MELPFHIVSERVLPDRSKVKRKRYREYWWLHAEPCAVMRDKLAPLSRYFTTTTVSKHRVFVWMSGAVLPDHQLVAFVSDDDASFGILHSRIHEVWARAQGTQVREREFGFRYTPTTCFETFPFPKSTDAQRESIAAVARELDALRNAWLNPPEWTRTEILEFPGSPTGPWRRYIDPGGLAPFAESAEQKVPVPLSQRNQDVHPTIATVRYPRTVPKDEECARELKKRTLTNLYNTRPTWLALAHQNLDAAVFTAYGWNRTMSNDDLLAALLALNLQRATH